MTGAAHSSAWRIMSTTCESNVITHVASKMTTIIWHMPTNRTLYSDRSGRLYQKKLKKLDAAE